MQRPIPRPDEHAAIGHADPAPAPMPVTVPPPATSHPRRADPFLTGKLLAAATFAAIVILMIGGYGMGWQWTGFGDNDHLWDYLHLLVLPVAIATLPVWLKTHRDRAEEWRWAVASLLAVFATLLIGGYALGWSWTGFASITLWDWLDLLVLPIVLTLMPLWLETHERLESRWIAGLSVVLAVFVVLVIGGYGLGWSWTGFPGNTVWDWLRLLLVPFALPAALAWYQATGRRYREGPRPERGTTDAPTEAAGRA